MSSNDKVSNMQFKNDKTSSTEEEVGIMGKLKNFIMAPVNFIKDKVAGMWNYLGEKIGDYRDMLWIVVGILVLSMFSPAAGFSAMMFVVSMAVYISIFIVIWNTINTAFGHSPI